MEKNTKLACIEKDCVACGCCLSVCPLNAIQIDRGVLARVNPELCIGCGRCAKACPAAVITVRQREVGA